MSASRPHSATPPSTDHVFEPAVFAGQRLASGASHRAGTLIDATEIVSAAVDGDATAESWRELTAHFRSAACRDVVCDVTPATLEYVPEAFAFGICPQTYPARVAALLYERYTALHGDARRGLCFHPRRPTPHYGEELRRVVLEHAQNWALPGAFGSWVRQANHFEDEPAEGAE